MTQVPEKVLAWLYSVLHEYHDSQRTYSDTVRTLSSNPSLSPRTEVYTYENGSPALLLTVSGTLPVAFRGATYRFPIKLWVPHSYPQEPPMVYVVPGRDMIIRPGQHVGVDGRVYHPYLRDWSRMWDRASVAEFLEFLQQVFAKEPPVISKAQQQQYQRPIGQNQQLQTANSAAPPQLPPKQQLQHSEPQQSSGGDAPPPRPPKPGDEYMNAPPPRTSSRDVTRYGPPLPPLPHELPSNQETSTQQRQNSYGAAGQPPSLGPSPLAPAYQNIPPPSESGQLPPLGWQHHGNIARSSSYEQSPVSPVSPVNGYSELPEGRALQRMSQSSAHPRPQPQQPQHPQGPQPTSQYTTAPQYQRHSSQPVAPPQYPPQPRQLSYINPQFRQQPPQKQPPPDLLSDPFDVALPGPLPSSGPPPPAPPIPPNPEKEHLLGAISTILVPQAQQKIHQNLSALAPLQAQQIALRAAHERLQAELRQLEALDVTLASNESILHRSIADCDRTIGAATSKPLPPVDDVLIAPTLVANQLWNLCAEEAACREAMYVLQKAVDRGRVSGSDFVRQMRSLGRERFLTMALARKCARGLGLEMAVTR